MRFYNTLSRKVEEFVPINKNMVTMYTCGPTVYHYAHIGYLRTYIMEDVLEKTLTYIGYNVYSGEETEKQWSTRFKSKYGRDVTL